MSDQASWYSIVNCYKYAGKSCFFSTVDYLSTPFREVFGGNNVYLMTGMVDKEKSVAKKVSILALCIIVFPVGIISFASFIIKISTAFLEKKKIVKNHDKTAKAINGFLKNCKNKNYDKAIKYFYIAPGISVRHDVNKYLYDIVSSKIRNNDSWKEVQEILSFLPAKESIKLIDDAIIIRFNAEIKSDVCITKAEDIFDFIKGSLPKATSQVLLDCFNWVLSSAFKKELYAHKIENKGYFEVNRISIASNLIDLFLQIGTITNSKIDHSDLILKANNMRLKFLDIDHPCYTIFIENKMDRINRFVEDMHFVFGFCHNRLSGIDNQEHEKIDAELHAAKEFANYMTTVAVSEEERKYFKNFMELFDNYDALIAAGTSKQIINDIRKCLKTAEKSPIKLTNIMANLGSEDYYKAFLSAVYAKTLHTATTYLLNASKIFSCSIIDAQRKAS